MDADAGVPPPREEWLSRPAMVGMVGVGVGLAIAACGVLWGIGVHFHPLVGAAILAIYGVVPAGIVGSILLLLSRRSSSLSQDRPFAARQLRLAGGTLAVAILASMFSPPLWWVVRRWEIRDALGRAETIIRAAEEYRGRMGEYPPGLEALGAEAVALADQERRVYYERRVAGYRLWFDWGGMFDCYVYDSIRREWRVEVLD